MSTDTQLETLEARQEITDEMFHLKNLPDLTGDVIVEAGRLPQGVAVMLAKVVADESAPSNDFEERARVVLLECVREGETSLGENPRRLVESIRNDGTETPFREILQAYYTAVTLPPQEQAVLISDHYRETLRQAAEINAVLSNLT